MLTNLYSASFFDTHGNTVFVSFRWSDLELSEFADTFSHLLDDTSNNYSGMSVQLEKTRVHELFIPDFLMFQAD